MLEKARETLKTSQLKDELRNHQTFTATSWCTYSWFISSPRSSHLTSVILTTIIIQHPIILLFQPQNFSFSQILPSADIWHLFGLISWIPGLLYSFSSFQFLRATAGTAIARLSHRNSVRLSVRLSVTRVDQAKTVQARIIKSSPSAAPRTLVSGSVTLFPKFRRGHPNRGP